MPIDVLHEPVEVLLEFPDEARLADARLADDGDQPCAFLACCGMEELLQQTQLLVATDKRWLEAFAAPAAAPCRDHPQGSPGRDGERLPFEVLFPDRFEQDGPAGGVIGALIDQQPAGKG